MVNVGDTLVYNGGNVLGYDDYLDEQDSFTLVDVEKTDHHTFYWIENEIYKIVLLNDEIGSFNVLN